MRVVFDSPNAEQCLANSRVVDQFESGTGLWPVQTMHRRDACATSTQTDPLPTSRGWLPEAAEWLYLTFTRTLSRCDQVRVLPEGRGPHRGRSFRTGVSLSMMVCQLEPALSACFCSGSRSVLPTWSTDTVREGSSR